MPLTTHAIKTADLAGYRCRTKDNRRKWLVKIRSRKIRLDKMVQTGTKIEKKAKFKKMLM